MDNPRKESDNTIALMAHSRGNRREVIEVSQTYVPLLSILNINLRFLGCTSEKKLKIS